MSQLPSFTKKELDAYYRRVDLIKQTADQIIKDFEWYGMEIKFSGDEATAYNELFKQIAPQIEKLLNSDYERLMQVLYHIDVSEEKVAGVVAGAMAEKVAAAGREATTSAQLTDLIIMRELQKVVTRNYFSGRM